MGLIRHGRGPDGARDAGHGGLRSPWRRVAYCLSCIFLSAPAFSQGSLPLPWLHSDVGAPDAGGDASYSGGTFTVTGDGTNIWGTADEIHFVYQAVSGDCEIVARVVSHDFDANRAKTGVMIRDGLAGDSPHASALLVYNDGAFLYYRQARGDGSDRDQTTSNSYSAPHWLRLVRVGDSFTAYASSNGSTWEELGQVTISMADPVYVGLCVTSRDPGVLRTATLDNVTVRRPPGAFSLLSPADGATGVSVTPAFDWQDSAGAEKYVLVVDEDPGFGSPDIYDNTLTTSAYASAAALNPNRRYSWKVTAVSGMWSRAASGSGISFWTEGTGVRVTSGLVVLYEFEEGAGTTVYDTSGFGTPMNLTVQDAGRVSWIPGGLSVDSSTIIETPGAGTKVINACRGTNEITIEAWIRPANTTQSGPARTVTLSRDPFERNFTLGQDWGRYHVRLRTTDNDLNGCSPYMATPAGTATTDLSHVVYTRTAAGQATCYVDGANVAELAVTGSLSNWDTGHGFGLANELTEDRTWLGSFRLVAIYSRALGPAEVTQNYDAGPDPLILPPPGAFDLLSPSNGATGVSLDPTLDWGDSQNADTFTLVLDDDANFSSPVIQNATLTDSTYTVAPGLLQVDTTYYWKATAVGAGGSTPASNNYFSFTTIPALPPPGAFNLLSPSNGLIGVPLDPTLDWGDSQNADTFALVLDDDPSFSTPVIQNTTLTVSVYSVPSGVLQADTTYYWRVTAVGGGGSTPAANNDFSFTTVAPLPPPGAFGLLSPVNGVMGVSLTPTLAWGDSLNAETYTLVVDDNADFSSPVLENATLTAGAYSVAPGSLQLDTTYYWKVTAVGRGGATPASNNYFTFRTVAELPEAPLDYLGGGCLMSARRGPVREPAAVMLASIFVAFLFAMTTRRAPTTRS